MGLFGKKPKEISKGNYELYHTLLSINRGLGECQSAIQRLSNVVDAEEVGKDAYSNILKEMQSAARHMVKFYRRKTHTDRED